MLLLSRFKGERVVIGNVIEVEVVELRGRRVRLGIEAPKEIAVHRLEVAQAIASQGGSNGNASSVCPCCGK